MGEIASKKLTVICPRCVYSHNISPVNINRSMRCRACGCGFPIKERVDSYVMEKMRRIQAEERRKGNKPSVLSVFGCIAGVLGLMMTFAAMGMDTTVSTDYGRVHDAGLMHERLCQLIVGLTAMAGGITMSIFGVKKERGG